MRGSLISTPPKEVCKSSENSKLYSSDISLQKRFAVIKTRNQTIHIKSTKVRHRQKRLAKKWLITYSKRHKAYRNKLKYYLEKKNSCQGKDKSTQKSINSILGRNKSITLVFGQCPEEVQICEAFNNYFHKYRKYFGTIINAANAYGTYLQVPTNYSVHLMTVTESETEICIKALASAVTRINDIQSRILKAVLCSILAVLTYLLDL